MVKKKKEEIDYKEIKVTDEIDYILKTENWGRCEFEICPVFKRGYLREVFFVRKQQKNEECYRLEIDKDIKVNVFHIDSWNHKTEHPKIWREFWCKNHKTISHDVYPPDMTSKIVFAYNFGNTLMMRFE